MSLKVIMFSQLPIYINGSIIKLGDWEPIPPHLSHRRDDGDLPIEWVTDINKKSFIGQ
jgi:hypothetical protein